MEVSEAVAAEKKEEEEEEAGGGECGARREPRPPIAAEAVSNKQGRPAADLSGARGCGGEEDGGGGKRRGTGAEARKKRGFGRGRAESHSPRAINTATGAVVGSGMPE